MQDRLSSTFHAMADPARRAILARLSTGATTVGELSRPLDMTAPAVSHHLKVLERAGLVDRKTMGQHRIISLKPERLRAATDWLEELHAFWQTSFERLDVELAAHAKREEDSEDE